MNCFGGPFFLLGVILRLRVTCPAWRLKQQHPSPWSSHVWGTKRPAVSLDLKMALNCHVFVFLLSFAFLGKIHNHWAAHHMVLRISNPEFLIFIYCIKSECFICFGENTNKRKSCFNWVKFCVNSEFQDCEFMKPCYEHLYTYYICPSIKQVLGGWHITLISLILALRPCNNR